MIAKLRPNVLLIALMAVILAGYALTRLLELFAGKELITPELLIAGLAGTVGLCIGSLLTLAGQVATDPPPPSIPAKEFPEIVRAIRGDDANTDSP